MKYPSSILRKILRYFIYGSLLSSFIFITIFLVVLYSGWGSLQLIKLTAYLAGGQVQVAKVSNGIAQNLSIEDLKYIDSQVKVDIKNVELKWDWLEVFSGEFNVAKFHLDKANIILLSTYEEKVDKPSKPFNYQELMNLDLALLINLKFNDISISETSFFIGEQVGGQKYSIEAAQLASSLGDGIFQIDIVNTNADIDGQGVGIDTSLKIDTGGDVLAINGDFAWETQIDNIRYSGDGSIEGDLSKLVIDHNLRKPWEIDTKVNFAVSQNMKPIFSIASTWEEIDLSTVKSPAKLKNGKVDISGDNHGLKYTLATQVDLIDLDNMPIEFAASGGFDWSKVNIDQMSIRSEDQFYSSFSGEIGIGQKIDWQIENKTEIANIDKYVPALGVEKISPEISFSGEFSLDNKNGDSKVSLLIPNLLGSEVKGDINLNFDSSQVEVISIINSPFMINSDVKYGIADGSIDTMITWQNVFWPLVRGAAIDNENDSEVDLSMVSRDDLVVSPNGKIAVSGNINDYKLDTNFFLKYNKWKPNIEVSGKGSLDRFQVDSLMIETIAGTLVSDAEIIWAPTLSWKTNVSGDGINLNAFDLRESNITFALKSSGSASGDKFVANAELSTLGGTIGKDKLTGAAKFDFKQVKALDEVKLLSTEDQQLRADKTSNGLTSDLTVNLGVNLGKTKAKLLLNALQNQRQQKINGRYDINVESLSQFIPRLKGQIKLLGEISGDDSGLKANGSAIVNNVKLDDIKLSKGEFDYVVKRPNEKDIFANLNGKLTDIKINQININNVDINGEGSLSEHNLKISADGDYTGKLKISGEMIKSEKMADNAAPQWKGVIEDFSLANKDIGNWTNDNIAISYRGDDLKVARTCFVRGLTDPNPNPNPNPNTKFNISDSANSIAKNNIDDEVCASSIISSNIIDVDLSINSLNLQRFSSLIPEGINMFGIVTGETSVYIKEFDYINAKVDSQLQTKDGRLELTLLDKKKKTLPLDLHFSTELDNRQGITDFKIKVNGGLDAHGKISFALPQRIELLDETDIDSTIKLDLSNFEWVDEIWPELESVKADLVANARVYGQLGDLKYTGSSNISNGSLSIISAGIVLSEVQLSVDYDTEKTIFSGKGKSGEGQISIAGDFNKQSLYPINIDILGDNFQVVDIYEAAVDISPLLKIKLLKDKAQIDGSINIDKARIRIGDLPETAISVSDDIIVMDSDAKNKMRDQYQTGVNIKLNLGDQFTFKGFGLTTKIIGALDIKQANGLREGFGELELKEGQFKNYGIKLDIETGQIIFVGPIDNPALNIKAARKLEKSKKSDKVSVMITGTLKKPVLVFPEESTYGQTNAMSNLLTGKSVGESGGGNSSTEALYSVGLSAGGRFKDQVQDELGIDSFEITAAGWMLGKYLTPDLYLSYSTGWLENETALKLRYSLSEMLSVEVKSGQQQGVDLFYSVEKPSK